MQMLQKDLSRGVCLDAALFEFLTLAQHLNQLILVFSARARDFLQRRPILVFSAPAGAFL